MPSILEFYNNMEILIEKDPRDLCLRIGEKSK
jgi:hypothetical protein